MGPLIGRENQRIGFVMEVTGVGNLLPKAPLLQICSLNANLQTFPQSIWYYRFMNYIKRELEPVLASLVAQFPAVSLTGPRQTGKSTLLRHLFPEAKYISFDDPLARQLAREDPERLLDMDTSRILLDEIQFVPELLSRIKIRIDNNRQAKGRYLLMGSQQFTLMKNLGDSLAGRIALLELLPLSFSEWASAGLQKSALESFTQSCLRGLFPEPALNLDMDASRWFSSYIQTYLERDIRTIFDIGNLHDFERFLQLLASRCAQELHLSSLASDVGVAVNTVKKWISLLEACRILYLLPPYHQNLGKRITKAPKVYFLDLGLVSFLTGIRTAEHLLAGPMGGALFENYCVQEAVKVFTNAGVPPRLYFLRKGTEFEVDLLLDNPGGGVTAFEIKLSQTPKAAFASSLHKFHKDFGLLKIQTMGLVSLSKESGPLSQTVSHFCFSDFLKCIKAAAIL